MFDQKVGLESRPLTFWNNSRVDLLVKRAAGLFNSVRTSSDESKHAHTHTHTLDDLRRVGSISLSI